MTKLPTPNRIALAPLAALVALLAGCTDEEPLPVAPTSSSHGAGHTISGDVLGPDGSLHLIVCKAHEQVSLPRSRLERFLDSVLAADVEDDNLRRQLRQMFADVPLPETMPAFASLTVDTDGDLWVKESAFPDTETNRWTVFGVDGVLLAQVDMPPRFTPHHVGTDFVLGVWTDEFEVEYVRLYELTKP